MYYNLKTKEIINEKQSLSLNFLYNTILGRLALKIACTQLVANTYAKYMNSKLSKHKIKKFIKNNNIDMSEYKETSYKSFNDFFMRELREDKRIINDGLISVCDSKLSVYKINECTSFKIKNSIYTVEELIQDKCSNYEYALVFRLCVDDYHHYVFPDNGSVIKSKYIKGILHTVQPIAFKKNKVFTENSRCVTYLNCDNLGNVCYIEVGAMMVGKIVNEKKENFKKGEEKGHFEFGGSTIILLIEKGKVKINKTILENTKNNIETIVKLGDYIGG